MTNRLTHRGTRGTRRGRAPDPNLADIFDEDDDEQIELTPQSAAAHADIDLGLFTADDYPDKTADPVREADRDNT